MANEHGVRVAHDRLLWALILLLGAIWFGWIERAGIGHVYYSASARTIADNPEFVFSGVLDPGAHVTVDKPPVGVWATAMGVSLFGNTWLGFVLPSAILAWLASWFAAGTSTPRLRLFTFLLVLVTPGVGVLARSSLPDATMLAAGCLGAWVLLTDKGPRPHATAGGLLAIAVLAKPGAVLMVPAFLVFMAASLRSNRTSFLRFAGAFGMVIAIWVLLASATPGRPYFGGTNNNSALEQLIGPATVSRIVDADLTSGDKWIGLQSAGEPGPLRSVTGRMGLQAGYLLVFAALAGARLSWDKRREPDNARIYFWMTWLATHVIAYSLLPGIAHAYYAASLGPPVAILATRALAEAPKDWVSMAGIGLSLYLTIDLLRISQPLSQSVLLLVAITGVLVGVAIAWRLQVDNPALVVVFAIVALLMTAVSVDQLVTGRSFSFDPGAGDRSVSTETIVRPLPDLEQVDARWALATDDEALASQLIATRGTSVMLVGGFLGRDPILSASELTALIEEGHVAYLIDPIDNRSSAARLLQEIADLCRPLSGYPGVRKCS